MGKHDAGRHARKADNTKSTKTLLWVVLAVALAAAVGAALFLTGVFRPVEEKISGTPEAVTEPETEERLCPAEEREDESAADLIEVPEIPASEEEEAVRVAGDIAPENEVPGSTGESELWVESAPREAGEIVLRLEAVDGLDHCVYIQQNPGGMAIVEYLVRGDVIEVSAESVYASVVGMDDMTVEGLAQGFTMTGCPEEYTDSVELFWERQGDWLIMVTVLEELDDPARLEAYGDHGLMRIVNDNVYYLAAAEEFLFGLGYEKQ